MIDTRLLLNTLLHLLPVLYGIALFNYTLVFLTDDRLIRRLARPILWVAVGVNVAYLLVYTVYFEHIPAVTVYQVLGAVGFSVAAVYLWVESRTDTPYTAPFLLFLVLVFQIVNAEFPKMDGVVPEILHSRVFSLHVVAAVVGYSALVVAAVYGLLYLILYQRMRNKKFGLVFRRLPPLETLDRMNLNAAWVGSAFLLLTVVLGLVQSRVAYGEIRIDAKVLVTILALVIYGGAVLARQFGRWRGSRLALSSVVGFLVLLFSVSVVNTLMSGFHSFG